MNGPAPLNAPVCECHGVTRLWKKDRRRNGGGYWVPCAVRHREKQLEYWHRHGWIKRGKRVRAAQRGRILDQLEHFRREEARLLRVIMQGDSPDCPCHGDRMYWQKDRRQTAGGRWVCAVRRRAYSAAVYQNETRRAKKLLQQRDRYDNDWRYRIEKRLHDDQRKRAEASRRREYALARERRLSPDQLRGLLDSYIPQEFRLVTAEMRREGHP